MAKKFYWLKLKKDFFKRHDVRIIESMPNGKDYLLFYLKLLVESLDHEGNLRFSETIPYSIEMLSSITNTNIDIVRSAMNIFAELQMIEILDDQTIFMQEVNKMIGYETDEHTREQNRIRQQRYRDKQRLEIEDKSLCNVSVTLNRNVEKELEIEKDKEIISKDIIRSNPSDLQRVIDAWNGLGLSKVTKIVEGTERYKWVKKRIKDYGLEQVIKAIEDVQYSDFLLNANFFSFDWMIRPNNFPKVMEGNYINRKAEKTINTPEETSGEWQ